MKIRFESSHYLFLFLKIFNDGCAMMSLGVCMQLNLKEEQAKHTCNIWPNLVQTLFSTCCRMLTHWQQCSRFESAGKKLWHQQQNQQELICFDVSSYIKKNRRKSETFARVLHKKIITSSICPVINLSPFCPTRRLLGTDGAEMFLNCCSFLPLTNRT